MWYWNGKSSFNLQVENTFSYLLKWFSCSKKYIFWINVLWWDQINVSMYLDKLGFVVCLGKSSYSLWRCYNPLTMKLTFHQDNCSSLFIHNTCGSNLIEFVIVPLQFLYTGSTKFIFYHGMIIIVAIVTRKFFGSKLINYHSNKMVILFLHLSVLG